MLSTSNNILLIISGPSGVGKGAISDMLEKTIDIKKSISATTRLPRLGEEEGVNYFFITKEDFKNKIENNQLLEYSEHFENFYGTPKDYVEETLNSGKDALLEIDVNGGLNIKKSMPEAVLVMVVPPKFSDLKFRLEKRKTESTEKITLRLSRAKFELENYKKYDYIVENDTVENATKQIINIIECEKLRAFRQGLKIDKIMEEE